MSSLVLSIARAGSLTIRRTAANTQGAAEQDPASLDRLHDLVLPGPIPPWPTTQGWILLGMSALVAVVGLAWYLVRRRRARTYRREALVELERIGTRVGQAADPTARASALGALAALLKRTALAAYPREQVAPLWGDAWLDFLAQGSGQEGFRTGPGRLLRELPYDPHAAARVSPEDAQALLVLSRGWILRHPACDTGERE